MSQVQVTDELIRKLAELSKLEFSDEEFPRIRQDLESMIRFVDKLRELDLDDEEPLIHMSEETDMLRDDIPGGTVSAEQALRNAPETDGRFFIVPKVIQK